MKVYDAVGRGPAPHSIYVRNDIGDNGPLVMYTHVGLNSRYRKIFEEMKNYLNQNFEKAPAQEISYDNGQKYKSTKLPSDDEIKNSFI